MDHNGEKIFAKYYRSLYLKFRDNSKEKDSPVENNIKLLKEFYFMLPHLYVSLLDIFPCGLSS